MKLSDAQFKELVAARPPVPKEGNKIPQWAVVAIVGALVFFLKDAFSRQAHTPTEIASIKTQLTQVAIDVKEIESDLKLTTRSRYTQEDASKDKAVIQREVQELRDELRRRSAFMENTEKAYASLSSRVGLLEHKVGD